MKISNTFSGIEFGMPVDINGDPVERSQNAYPYSYSEFVTWRNGQNSEINDSVYSDRLYGWDPQKYNSLCQKHFENKGHNWSSRHPTKIQQFLRDYMDNQEIRLIVIVQGCNVSNGYPYWIFRMATK